MSMKLATSWHEALRDELSKPYIAELKSFLAKEKSEGKIIYPPEDLIFNAFLHTPFEKVKVVIMGQDPYHGPGQAHGLSFSVPSGMPQPPSLKNIFKELQQDLGISVPKDGCLSLWAQQGVLLLNATLTVRKNEPKSHYGRGWESFTNAVIARLAEREDPLIFVLWGKSAQEKIAAVLEKKTTPHVVLQSAHPSPYSAGGFFGCRHFSQINRLLKDWGKEPINWQLS
jgi:uracil-DNA glycosylase